MSLVSCEQSGHFAFSGPNQPKASCDEQNSNNIKVQLDRPQGGISEFHIVCNGAGCPEDLVKVAPDVLFYDFKGLTPYTKYTFTVKAIKTYGQQPGIKQSKSSSEFSFTCQTSQKGNMKVFTSHFLWLNLAACCELVL